MGPVGTNVPTLNGTELGTCGRTDASAVPAVRTPEARMVADAIPPRTFRRLNTTHSISTVSWGTLGLTDCDEPTPDDSTPTVIDQSIFEVSGVTGCSAPPARAAPARSPRPGRPRVPAVPVSRPGGVPSPRSVRGGPVPASRPGGPSGGPVRRPSGGPVRRPRPASGPRPGGPASQIGNGPAPAGAGPLTAVVKR